MRRKKRTGVGHVLEGLSSSITRWTGSASASTAACAIVVIWGLTGPLFGYSDTWQLVINTGTTIVTFLMVFLIQPTQNKESMAIQLKLNEIVAALDGASNRLVDVEDLSEEELATLHKHYAKLVVMARTSDRLTESRSIEEAEARRRKKERRS